MSSLDPNNWAGQVVALVLAALFGLGAVIGYYQLTYAHYSSKGKLVRLAVLELAVFVPVGGQTALLGQPGNCPCSVTEYQEAMSRAEMAVFLTALGLVVAAIAARPAMRLLPKSWMWKWLLHAYGVAVVYVLIAMADRLQTWNNLTQGGVQESYHWQFYALSLGALFLCCMGALYAALGPWNKPWWYYFQYITALWVPVWCIHEPDEKQKHQ